MDIKAKKHNIQKMPATQYTVECQLFPPVTVAAGSCSSLSLPSMRQ